MSCHSGTCCINNKVGDSRKKLLQERILHLRSEIQRLEDQIYLMREEAGEILMEEDTEDQVHVVRVVQP